MKMENPITKIDQTGDNNDLVDHLTKKLRERKILSKETENYLAVLRTSVLKSKSTLDGIEHDFKDEINFTDWDQAEFEVALNQFIQKNPDNSGAKYLHDLHAFLLQTIEDEQLETDFDEPFEDEKGLLSKDKFQIEWKNKAFQNTLSLHGEERFSLMDGDSPYVVICIERAHEGLNGKLREKDVSVHKNSFAIIDELHKRKFSKTLLVENASGNFDAQNPYSEYVDYLSNLAKEDLDRIKKAQEKIYHFDGSYRLGELEKYAQENAEIENFNFDMQTIFLEENPGASEDFVDFIMEGWNEYKKEFPIRKKLTPIDVHYYNLKDYYTHNFIASFLDKKILALPKSNRVEKNFRKDMWAEFKKVKRISLCTSIYFDLECHRNAVEQMRELKKQQVKKRNTEVGKLKKYFDISYSDNVLFNLENGASVQTIDIENEQAVRKHFSESEMWKANAFPLQMDVNKASTLIFNILNNLGSLDDQVLETRVLEFIKIYEKICNNLERILPKLDSKQDVKLIEIINSVIERDALDERLRCLNELQTYLQTNVELKNKYNEFRQYEVLNNLDQLYTHQGNRVVIMTFG
jgi:hypothetical protein